MESFSSIVLFNYIISYWFKPLWSIRAKQIRTIIIIIIYYSYLLITILSMNILILIWVSGLLISAFKACMNKGIVLISYSHDLPNNSTILSITNLIFFMQGCLLTLSNSNFSSSSFFFSWSPSIFYYSPSCNFILINL